MQSIGLLEVLQNELIFRHLGPYLGISLLSLAATSKAIRVLVSKTPGVLAYLDLSGLRSLRSPSLAWKDAAYTVRAQEGLTEEELYSRPLDEIFSALSSRGLMRQVRTLILDGASLTATTLTGLLCNSDCSIRILSIRGVYGISYISRLAVLRYVFRSSRLQVRHTLKALYFCSSPQKIGTVERAFRAMTVIGEHEHFSNNSVLTRSGASLGAGIRSSGKTRLDFDPFAFSPYSDFGHNQDIAQSASDDAWLNFIRCHSDSLAFDVVLCPGDHILPNSEVATVRLSGCQSCGSCPEKPAFVGQSVSSVSMNRDSALYWEFLPLHS